MFTCICCADFHQKKHTCSIYIVADEHSLKYVRSFQEFLTSVITQSHAPIGSIHQNFLKRLTLKDDFLHLVPKYLNLLQNNDIFRKHFEGLKRLPACQLSSEICLLKTEALC